MQSTFRNAFVRTSTKFLRRQQQTVPREISNAYRITSVEPDPQKRMVTVHWEDGSKGKFPFVWLLDWAPLSAEENKQADPNKDSMAHHRMLTLNELNLQVKPEKLALHPEGERLFVHWPPFHEVAYESDWLKEHVFVANSASGDAERKAVTWGRSDLQDRLPTISAQELLHGNFMLIREKLLEFSKFGILVVKNGANDKKALEALGYKSADLQANVVRCFTHGVQGLHTGEPYMDTIPAVGILVVRSNPSDDEATLQIVDGFRVAEQLQETHPAVFTFLCNTPIDYNNLDSSQSMSSPKAKPVFTLSPTGIVQRITFNNALRSSRFTLPPENLEDFYKALKTFNSYCYQSRNLLNIHVNDGDAVFVHNHRILHGNTAYSMGNESWVDEVFVDEEPLKQTLKRLQGY